MGRTIPDSQVHIFKRKPENPPPNPLIKKSEVEPEDTYSIYKYKIPNENIKHEFKELQPINYIDSKFLVFKFEYSTF